MAPDARRPPQPAPAALAAIRHRPTWAYALLALLVNRLVSVTLGVISADHAHHAGLISAPTVAFSGLTVKGANGWFTAWDSVWYLAAAQHGWAAHPNTHTFNTTGFFPGLPLALRVVHAFGLPWSAAGVVTEVLLEVVAVLAIASLAEELLGPRRASFAVIAVCLFPGAYVFSQVYTEPMFMAAAALCLLALQRRAWWQAGVAAAVAGATRSTGVALILCCVWAAGWALARRRDWRALLAPALSVLGLAATGLFLLIRTGSVWTYQRTQEQAWNQRFTLHAIDQEFHAWSRVSYGWVLPVFFVWAAVSTVVLVVLVARRRLPGIWLIYSVAAVAVTLLTENVGVRPRMALVAFPLIIADTVVLTDWWQRARGVHHHLGGALLLSSVAAYGVGLAYFSSSIQGFVP